MDRDQSGCGRKILPEGSANDYNADSGRLETVTAPDNAKTTTTYNDLGQVIKVEEDDTGTDERHNLTQYDGLGNVTKLIADTDKDDTYSGGGWSDPGTEDGEVTTYLFKDTIDASRNTSIIYPDSSDVDENGTDQVKLEYNLDGSLSKRTDQRGTVIAYTYTNRRNRDTENVTAFGGADPSVQSIKREYDNIGRLEKITSYDDNATIVNQIVLEYDELANVTKVWQSHQGAAVTTGTGQSPMVQYTYDSSTTSGIFDDGYRLQKVTYPNGRIVHYDYGSSGSMYDLQHRLRYIKDDLNGSPNNDLVAYGNNASGRLVRANYKQAKVRLLTNITGSGTYDGYDRFGRIKDHYWQGYNGGADADRFKYEYDYAGNPKYRDIDASIYTANNKDQAYTYDGLDRLKTYNRGQLTGGSTISDTSANLNQSWTLDALGNWTTFKWDDNGGGDSWTTQTRNHNDVNEIDTDNDHVNAPGNSISGTGADWIDPKYDAAGNMTEGPAPGNETVKQKYVYDAWNRLGKVTDASDVDIAVYEYDGLGRRIVKTDKTQTPNITYDYFYNQRWQVLEVRKDADTDPIEQYVWHPYYVDALAVRYYDSNTDGAGILEQYFTHDANYNLASLLDGSGVVQERYEYRAYGQLTILDADFSDDADNVSDFANPYSYTGRRFDPETKLFYYRHRFYHPTLGRFLTRDPIGYEGGSNLYEFAASRSTSARDPFGLLVVEGVRGTRLGESNGAKACKRAERNGVSMTWRFWFGDGTQPAPRNGYFVQYVRGGCSAYRDGVPVPIAQPTFEYFEAFRIFFGQPFSRPLDTARYRVPGGLSGNYVQFLTSIKFVPDEAINLAGWTAGGRYGSWPCTTDSGTVPSIAATPALKMWFANLPHIDPVGQPGGRTFRVEWNCRGKKLSDYFVDADAGPEPGVEWAFP